MKTHFRRLFSVVLCVCLLFALCAPALAITMQIFVRNPLTGKQITLEVASTDTIASVKEKLWEKEKFPVDQQTLTFKGTVLEDSLTLEDYGVGKEGQLGLTVPVAYLDANGETQTRTDYRYITWATTAWGAEGEETWYVVSGNVSIGNVTVSGNVHLILMDGCSLTACGTSDFYDDATIKVTTGDSLTIYAQSDGGDMGALTVSEDYLCYGAGIGGCSGDTDKNCGDVTINGGNITVFGKYESAAIGGGNGGAGGVVTINGG